MNPNIIIIRNYESDKLTLGNFFIFQGTDILFQCKCLERGWKNNENKISCIPKGIYDLEWEYSDKFKTNLWELKGVPGRSEIKIHVGNHVWQLEGCILVGDRFTHIDNDNLLDISNSRNTLNKIHNLLKDYNKLKLTIY